MKNLLFLMAIMAGIASAQTTVMTDTLNNNWKDTSEVVQLDVKGGITYFITTADSMNAVVYVDYRMKPLYQWATTAPETVTVIGAKGYGVTLRAPWKNDIPTAQQLRFRVEKRATGNNTQAGVKWYSVILFKEN